MQYEIGNFILSLICLLNLMSFFFLPLHECKKEPQETDHVCVSNTHLLPGHSIGHTQQPLHWWQTKLASLPIQKIYEQNERERGAL